MDGARGSVIAVTTLQGPSQVHTERVLLLYEPRGGAFLARLFTIVLWGLMVISSGETFSDGHLATEMNGKLYKSVVYC